MKPYGKVFKGNSKPSDTQQEVEEEIGDTSESSIHSENNQVK